MKEGIDLNGALNWLAEYHGHLLSNFQAQQRLLPSWDHAADTDTGTRGEIGLRDCGKDCWSLETE